MKEVRGGSPNTTRARGSNAAGQAAITRANTQHVAHFQDNRFEGAQQGHNLAANIRGANRHRRRQRLIDDDLRRHGSIGIRALLDGLELDYGIPDIDRRIERLINADPAALALLEQIGGAG